MAAKLKGTTLIVTGDALKRVERAAKNLGVPPKWILIHALVNMALDAKRSPLSKEAE